jgi:hypothetical protein
MSGITSRAQATARQADSSDWIDWSARAGLVAYGVVHLVLAWLALQLALGDREGTPNQSGAVQELAKQPFGAALVWAIAVGLFLLVVWQGIEAVVGHREEDGAKLAFERAKSAGKAVLYGAIGVSAVRAAMGSGSSGGSSDQQTDSMTGKLMSLPAGQVLVGAVGLAIVCVGAYQVHKGWSEKFRDELSSEGTSGQTGRAYLVFGKVGYTAKGVVLGIVGVLFGWAAITHDPDKSGGLDQALYQLLDQPFGPYLLGVVAVGIACFGAFCFARARHLSR